jgi:hypothetical protein
MADEDNFIIKDRLDAQVSDRIRVLPSAIAAKWFLVGGFRLLAGVRALALPDNRELTTDNHVPLDGQSR